MTAEAATPNSSQISDRAAPVVVRLSDGTQRDVSGLSVDQLVELQWQEERRFAQQILTACKCSTQRAEITSQGYDTITTLLRLRDQRSSEQFAMGHSPRYERLVLRLLAERHRRGIASPILFEIGFGSGLLLKRIQDQGYVVGGLEVSQGMYELARRRLGDQAQLHLGDLRSLGKGTRGKFHVVFWNDVFEHIAPDEILDYLRIIHELLAPGGVLVTITPNWHVRPSDITSKFMGPRSEAVGFHLKEYTLGEVAGLLRQAGFKRVATPLLVTRPEMIFCGSGLAGCKRLLEPCLEWLPFRLTRVLCTGLGLDCTVAQKGIAE
ncbi:MAG TPA: class I SAM-dependent methyltransferase [Pirellulales bacterium]|jgi:2-polyprenyl-3-methyl-5-hydroxy-6-metoxy-1,4-benzoquinol methylase|nr:class I SAM-dependent methyltransferase [Pirellulales bacterium]